jgi:diguanylate cyclase (GGDEF)-like protein
MKTSLQPMRDLRPALRRVGAVVLAAWALQGVAATTPSPAPHRPNAFAEQVDTLVADGYEHPAHALLELRAMARDRTRSPDERRTLLLAIGSIEASSGGAIEAGAAADQLLALAPEDPTGRTLAASNLVRAQVAMLAGQVDVAAALAQSALPAFHTGCPGGPAAPIEGRDCNYRAAWRALQILERRAFSQGLLVSATAHAQSALTLAEWADDVRRRIVSLNALAQFASARGEHELARDLATHARRLVARSSDPADAARVSDTEARLAKAQGDNESALRLHQQALTQAAQAHASRLEGQLLTSLSDVYARLGQPARALQAAERALVIVRRHNDLRTERVLINNAGIAKIGLGRVAEGRRDLTRLLELWRQSGETGRQAATLLEFGEALAAAGDARGALELYHQERAVTAEVMRANRSIALKELQTRNDADARQRDIELLGRDNALKTAAIANRDLLQRLWWLLAAVMGLACVLVTILYRRVRDTHRRLEASRVQLQAQSERDPLTNLANRRHFQSVMTTLCGHGGFEGALLLVDIDHFKHVNDVQGHAAGDQVLVEVARRLNDAVRSGDLVVRWGGEEFLILAPRAANEQAEQVAARVLRILGQTPITVGNGADAHALHITASIGYARFPLPPYDAEVPWEQAVNLVDMALYTAKNQGRNRAVGIVSSTAATREALQDVEVDFDRARHEGRVTLLQTQGPEQRDNVRAA